MQSYFVSKKYKNNRKIFYIKNTESDYHHLKHVLRINDGEGVICIFKQVKYLCTVQTIQSGVLCNVKQTLKQQPLLNFSWCLFFPWLKNQNDEYIIQKAVELGVNKLVPVFFERSVAKDKSLLKQQRLQTIIKNAAQQSQRINVPVLVQAIKLQDIVFYQHDLLLLANENEKTINNFNSTTKDYQFGQSIGVLVGPEGGITQTEKIFLTKNNFLSISLGHNILRSDTAVIYLLSLVKNLLAI